MDVASGEAYEVESLAVYKYVLDGRSVGGGSGAGGHDRAQQELAAGLLQVQSGCEDAERGRLNLA